MIEVTFRDFAELARRREWTVEFLAERFQGWIEAPRDFFCRVMQGQHADVVIPYRSVLDLYQQELAFEQAETGRERRCFCGCGQRVWGQKKWATPGCRKRAQRGKSETAIFACASG